jgi:saccharopine dehydrogenase (NADP+, L-glutamate forming)
MAGEAGAQYMENGQIKIVPPPMVFGHTWPVDVDGIGRLEAYANRDSLSYLDVYGLRDVHTMIRGTLRWPGWSETWAQIVRLGLSNERMRIPNLAERTYREVTEMFLPLGDNARDTEQRLARHLQINRTGKIMDDLRWLGLFSDEKTGCAGDTAAAMLIDLLRKKMPLEPDMTDVVVLVHHIEADYPDRDRPAERIRSTMVERGEPGGFTAMARTVGLPAAIAAKLLMLDELPLTGALIPTHPSVFEPVLRELGELGIRFRESVSAL